MSRYFHIGIIDIQHLTFSKGASRTFVIFIVISVFRVYSNSKINAFENVENNFYFI